ncbi:MAG: hypothetical protein V4643_14330 [Bacteroidota bacterium]
MDIPVYIQKMNDFQSQGVNNYQFQNEEDIVLIISGLRGLRQHNTAIQLYQKYEQQLKQSKILPVALTNIIEVCNESKNTILLVQYTKELKNIYPDHPYVVELSKFHSL